ncbi:hypothetical protein [Streptomyces sp. NPDC047981]|uniref:hypothetical protein n=1 Tax=Streptomyces sp. NPDC047981 TaxID=3154610 RepID=UPI00343E8785
MPHDDRYGDLEKALRTALTRGGVDPEVEPAALAAFRAARHIDRPTRRGDDWTSAAGRSRRTRRSLRTVLAGLIASAALGGVALAAGDLPAIRGDRPESPVPEPTTSTPHHPTSAPAGPTRAGSPRPSTADPAGTPTGRDDTMGRGPGKGQGIGNSQGQGRGTDQGAKNGRPKNDRPGPLVESPGTPGTGPNEVRER